MHKRLSHRHAIYLMMFAAALWSIAGVLTRHLDAAHGFEITFWRSMFAALFVFATLQWRHQMVFPVIAAAGKWGLMSGLMWGVMFCCFMIALSMTTVANTLIVMSVSPLLTAMLAALVLRQQIAMRTWLAIALACAGMVWMFAGGMETSSSTQFSGMLIAMGVPVAAAINFIILKKAGQRIDLMPSVMLGGIFSALAMLPLAWPLQASSHDIGLLAVLGIFQLGLPCMLMVIAARSLSAPEMSLLALLEVVLGPVWAWLGAGEVPLFTTLWGGALVLTALLLNELAALGKAARVIQE